MVKEQNKNVNIKIYTPQTLIAIHKHLREGDLVQIAVKTQTTANYVGIVMRGNRNMCVCRQGKGQEIVLAALELLELRKTEAKAKRDAALAKLESFRKEVSNFENKIISIDILLMQPSQNN